MPGGPPDIQKQQKELMKQQKQLQQQQQELMKQQKQLQQQQQQCKLPSRQLMQALSTMFKGQNRSDGNISAGWPK